MTPKTLSRLFADIRHTAPLVHCITNPISINQCANAILAVGAKPIMAEHPEEVGEITATANALLLNLGSITDARMQAMEISAERATELGIPFVLDLVGVSCSKLRLEFAKKLISRYPPSVIKGNYSEIVSVFNPGHRSLGIDADGALAPEAVDTAARELSASASSVILASGKIDISANQREILHIHGGSPRLAEVTGTGCMLGALCATLAASAPPHEAAKAACILLSACGKNADTDFMNGSFTAGLIDNLCLFTSETEKYLKSEDYRIEKI